MSTPIEPLTGRLVPLRTRDEVRASLETCTVYVVEVPAKHANSVKDALQAALPDYRTSEISHLRRVVQFKFLPWHLQRQFYPPARLPRVRYFLLCPTRHIGETALCDVIRETPAFEGRNAPPRIFSVTVPSMAPISAEQAELWSDEYWPIAYKNTNPYGPHPSLVQRNTEELEPYAGKWLAIAKGAGKQISHTCLGEDIGVVVVDQTKENPEIIAAAGDCRWRSLEGNTEPPNGTGNVMAHAVQRAIAMVAKKRLRAGGTDPALLDRSLFCDVPLTDIEKEYFKQDNVTSSGYLCVDLDIYLTNEPCLMCSMAILHSRFRRCIFAKRMPRTGALTADDVPDPTYGEVGLKTGLFWRPSELNWKFLAWEYQQDGESWRESAELATTMENMGLDEKAAHKILKDNLQA